MKHFSSHPPHKQSSNFQLNYHQSRLNECLFFLKWYIFSLFLNAEIQEGCFLHTDDLWPFWCWSRPSLVTTSPGLERKLLVCFGSIICIIWFLEFPSCVFPSCSTPKNFTYLYATFSKEHMNLTGAIVKKSSWLRAKERPLLSVCGSTQQRRQLVALNSAENRAAKISRLTDWWIDRK